MDKIKIIAVVGPTAVGKTKLSIEICKKFDGEVISCDSMQIYKKMDIGTAKPTKAEMCGIKHRLIDICDCTDEFSCSDYCAVASREIAEVAECGKIPVLCGGTGLYLDSLLRADNISPVGSDESLRAELNKLDNDTLYAMLESIDPECACTTHKNNKKRVIRAIEIYKLSGVTKTEWDKKSREQASHYEPLIIGLNCEDRSVLYSRIDKRVDKMMLDGLLDEVKSLPQNLSKTAVQAIGYKEIIEYFNGNLTLEEATKQIKQSSRNYAKRQLTWFKRNKEINWFYTDNGLDSDEILNFIESKF